jgi:hypothetical protein
VSWEATRVVVEYSRQRNGNLLVLLVIAHYAQPNGFATVPVKLIAKGSRVSVRHLQRCLRELEAARELKIERNAGPGRCNCYQIAIMRGPVDEVTSVSG